MASLAERSCLLPEEVSSGHGVDLLVGHLLGGLDAAHLEHHLLQDQQVQTLLALQLVRHVLQDARQVDAVKDN